MYNEIEYKGIKYQEINNQYQLKRKAKKLLLNKQNEIREIKREIKIQERKKEVTLSVNLPIALIFLSVFGGIIASFCFGSNNYIMQGITITIIYLCIVLFLCISVTKKVLDRYNQRIDLYESIKDILEEENYEMKRKRNTRRE